MFSRTLLAFVAITSLACVVAPQAKEPQVEGDRLVFELPDLDGKIVRSSDARFEGKVLFATLWGTWCPPCQSEIPTFNDLQASRTVITPPRAVASRRPSVPPIGPGLSVMTPG